MDNTDKELENGLESIYDWIRRPFDRYYLNLAVTQKVLEGLKNTYLNRFKNIIIQLLA
jgi:hypothetical protein